MFQFSLDNFEDQIELDIEVDHQALNNLEYNWVKYNPRKEVQRYGCSITSLDGNNTGIPDIDSLPEYNKINSTSYKEKDFSTPTQHSLPFTEFLSNWKVGRSHYIKLEAGGFFPWHRDSDAQSFRLIYTIENCIPGYFLWVHDDKVLKFLDRKWYFINTKKKHCLFAFKPCIFAVFNVLHTPTNFQLLHESFIIK